MTARSQYSGNLLSVVENGAGAESTVPVPSASGTETTATRGGRDDLTAFFSIGIVVDVLLVAAFLVWAVGQWRKTKK